MPSGVEKRRRTRRRNVLAISDLTNDDWMWLVLYFNGFCAYCGNAPPKLTKDCIIPQARGGIYTLINVVPACPQCNSSKSGKNVYKWMRSRGWDVARFEATMERLWQAWLS